ncbi:hypothetical protein L6452_41158 [Arctium lappa]|uniref:Uncharacterized protein n=1 Tax=Arctium lappa TaxID=4217 RepID=A0ACB8XNQ4_ARCLA|nr:hypothetical protein L6452_41158 [Arctium lappa]
MATIHYNDNWVQFNSHQNHCFEEDEEEEVLSLCDLPTNDLQIDTNPKKQDHDTEDFEFGSRHHAAAALSPENMCNADDVFFQGQILPLRHSVSSDEFTRKINRSASMSFVNTRSTRPESDPNPTRSNGYKYKPRTRNQFHSHPSPSPQIRTRSFRTLSHSNSKTSSLWSFLQVGLLKPQEIGLSDLKNRSKRFGSHNSNSSSTSSSMNSTIEQNQNQNQNQNKIEQNHRKNTKKKQKLLFSGCKCSAVSIESTRKDTIEKKKKIRTIEENGISTMMIGEGKQAVSRHRTFEWLKQLSIAAGPSEG